MGQNAAETPSDSAIRTPPLTDFAEHLLALRPPRARAVRFFHLVPRTLARQHLLRLVVLLLS